MNKTVKIPGPEHPITITPVDDRVTVALKDTLIADSTHVLALQEADYPEVLYIPRADVRMDLLERSSSASHCPYKGDAAYYSIPAAGERGTDAVWTYEQPHAAVAQISTHLAFYPDRVDAIEKS